MSAEQRDRAGLLITSGHLADGREIIFYDRAPIHRPIRDHRDLPPVPTSSHLRRDPLADEWVAVTTHRQARTHRPPAEFCPLCPTRGERLTEVPEPHYDVVVLENRFPSFATPANEDVSHGPSLRTDGHQPAGGRCEVVCFTDEHEGSFAGLTQDKARLVVDVWAHRTSTLSEMPDVEQVFCFENRGAEVGVTLSHPHGQVYAYPFVAPTTLRVLQNARAHRDTRGGSLFGEVIAQELRDQTRVVLTTSHWVAFVPEAARWPVEVHLYPRRQVPDLPALTDDERDDLALAYVLLLRAGDALFGVPLPYMASWFQAPAHRDRDLAWLHLRLQSVRRAPDKLKYLAASESAMGVFINDVAPEDVAARLRSAIGAPALASLD